jgi:segregation and condensation protein A
LPPAGRGGWTSRCKRGVGPPLNPSSDRNAVRGTDSASVAPGGEGAHFPDPHPAFGAFQVALPTFEGPLDLLLHLIREHKIDVFDIPVSLIAEKYNASLELMRDLNLDVAGEFLVMAATLAHIKSRMLLPRAEPLAGELDAEAEGDPRAELVRRLLTYQKYREAARELAEHPLLGRDVFARHHLLEMGQQRGPAPLIELSVFRLIEALDRVLKLVAPDRGHEVVREQVSLSAAMEQILLGLKTQPEMAFLSLFTGHRTRGAMVVTFLALLEMVRLRRVRVRQPEDGSDILVAAQGEAHDATVPEVDEREYR